MHDFVVISGMPKPVLWIWDFYELRTNAVNDRLFYNVTLLVFILLHETLGFCLFFVLFCFICSWSWP